MLRTTIRALATAGSIALLASAVAGPTLAQGGVNEAAKSHDFEWGTFTLSQRIIDKAAAGETINIVVTNEGPAIPVYGVEQLIGVNRGCEANGDRGLTLNCRLVGPVPGGGGYEAAQLAELDALFASDQVDCLGIESHVPNAFVDIINKYVDAGIPVFTQNTDVPSSKRFAFFALNERDAGRINGRVTAELVTAQGLPVDTVALGSGSPEGPWAQNRMGGFAEGFKETFPEAVFKQDEMTGLPTGPTFETAETIANVGPYLTGNPDVNLFFHSDQGVLGVGTAIKDLGLTGKVWTSGFNVDQSYLDLMDEGIILVLINQGFDNQSEAAVRACVDYLVDGVTPEDPLAYVDPVVITKDGGEGRQSSAEARQHVIDITTPAE